VEGTLVTSGAESERAKRSLRSQADWSNLKTACLAFRVIRGISWIVLSEPKQTIHESHETHE
jgi:hypothetical protein